MDIRLARCLDCGIIFTDPHPGPELLKSIYDNDSYYSYVPFYRSPETSSSGLWRSIKRWMKSTVMDQYHGYGKRDDNFKTKKALWLTGRILNHFVREDVISSRRIVDYITRGKHLDIGCGSGAFVWWMEKHGWQSQGIEINNRAVEAARKEGLNVIQCNICEADFQDATFDLVTAWEVIEHLPRLITQLKIVHRILKTNGRLVGSVPNAESWEARLFEGNWQPWEIPSHLYHFTPASLKKILSMADFALVKFEFLPITHSWDASCDLVGQRSWKTASLLRPLGKPFYAVANLAGRGARIRFEAIAI